MVYNEVKLCQHDKAAEDGQNHSKKSGKVNWMTKNQTENRFKVTTYPVHGGPSLLSEHLVLPLRSYTLLHELQCIYSVFYMTNTD